MAKKQTVTYVSDLSGSEITDNDAPTLTFGWDGTEYEIDLTAKEAEKFYSVMEKYLSVATKVGGKRRGKAKTSTGPSAAELREWAQSNGIDVPDRGRIPAAVRDAFNAAK